MQRKRQDSPIPSAPESVAVHARVRSVGADRWIDLAMLPGSRCEGCKGTCLWGWSPPSSLQVRDSACHRPGDLVSVSLPNRHVLRGALLVHGLPWAGLLAGTVVGVASLGGDLGASLGAAAGLGIGLLAGRRLQGRWRVCPELVKCPILGPGRLP